MIHVNQILVYTLIFDSYIQAVSSNKPAFSGLDELGIVESASDPVIKCPAKGILRHVMPGTRCRRHYMCRDGKVVKQNCPGGTIFSHGDKRCRVEGKCYELVCVGRRDAFYSDGSTGGARIFKCSGGRVVEISNILKQKEGHSMERAEAALVLRLPAFCEDKADGFHALTPAHDSKSDCSIYARCKSGIDVDVKKCPPSQFFDGRRCSATAKPCRDPCWGQRDGRHADNAVRCTGYYECEGGKTRGKYKCPSGTVFDGRSCSLSGSSSECSSSESDFCRGIRDGRHPDVTDPSCRRFVECLGGTMTVKSCPNGQTWNGTGCSNAHCVRTHSNQCRLGYTVDRDCKVFSFCHSNVKITFSCRPGMRFNGNGCVPDQDYSCPSVENSCRDKSPGYYEDVESNCRAYFYCGAGIHKITYVCPPNQLFDGDQCVPQSTYRCSSRANGECSNRTDGYHRRHLRPQEYVYCRDGVKLVTLNCPEHHQLDAMKGCLPEN